MNDLNDAIARLKELGATDAEIQDYTREFMASAAAPADATRALQRERPDASGDFEAVGPTALKLAGVAATMIPAGRVAGVAGRAIGAGARRAAPHLAEAFPGKIRALGRAGQALFKRPKGLPNLDDALIEPQLPIKGAPTRSLEEAVGMATKAEKAWKPRGATKARFDYIAELMAKRKAAGEVGEPALEDLLGLSLDHIKRGGSLKSASDALKIVRRQ